MDHSSCTSKRRKVFATRKNTAELCVNAPTMPQRLDVIDHQPELYKSATSSDILGPVVALIHVQHICLSTQCNLLKNFG
jgi:hypothetical protein